jgi:Cytochrome C oxidase, cbb3-type, subunit III
VRTKLPAVLVLVATLMAMAIALAQDQEPTATGGKSVTTPLYSVQDGNKVDPRTLAGWKTWRALACDRCHGQEQEGLVGPSLIDSLKVLSKDQFRTTVMEGRIEKGMPPWNASPMMQENWEGLYAYLKGRADGNIAVGHLYPLAAGGNAPAK